MNKLLTTIAAVSITAISFTSANSAEFRLGLMLSADGSYGVAEETLKDSGRKTEEHAVMVDSSSSGFAEVAFENLMGITVGLEVTTQAIELEKETRVIRAEGGTDAGADSGTQDIQASVEDYYVMYVAIPLGSTGAYAKLGLAQAELQTKETLATGSSYANVDMEGTQLGMGYLGTLGERGFYKLETTYTEFDKMGLNGSEAGATAAAFNKIDAQITGVSARVAFGVRF